MLRIQLEEDRPGYAKFTATKWSGSTEVEIAVQRNQDGCYFNGNDTPWNPEPVWHKVEGLTLENDVLQGVIGKWLIDSLVQQIGNVRYMMSVRDVQNLSLIHISEPTRRTPLLLVVTPVEKTMYKVMCKMNQNQSLKSLWWNPLL